MEKEKRDNKLEIEISSEADSQGVSDIPQKKKWLKKNHDIKVKITVKVKRQSVINLSFVSVGSLSTLLFDY